MTTTVCSSAKPQVHTRETISSSEIVSDLDAQNNRIFDSGEQRSFALFICPATIAR